LSALVGGEWSALYCSCFTPRERERERERENPVPIGRASKRALKPVAKRKIPSPSGN